MSLRESQPRAPGVLILAIRGKNAPEQRHRFGRPIFAQRLFSGTKDMFRVVRERLGWAHGALCRHRAPGLGTSARGGADHQ